MTVWAWLKLTAALWLIRKAFRLTWWLLLAVAAIAAWPVTVVTAAGYTAAWLRGWPPVRLYRAAAWSLPVTAAWLVDLEIRVPGFLAARDPRRTWAGGWDHLTTTRLVGVFAALAPAVLPAGLALAGLIWAWRNYAITAGLGGKMASAPITFDARQWNRQVRTARGLTHAPGAVPLLARGNKIPVGGTIRAIGHPWHPVLTLEPGACARHMVIVGSTGSGKTNLMIRLWAGWFTATLHASRAGNGSRPLLVVLDCKGGRDARRKADRTRRLLYAAGARRVAIWPDEARLSMWDLPPQDLAVLLYQMIESGTGAAAYYADMLYACVVLAVTAPPGPPFNTASFLDRLDTKWLQHAWGDGRHPRQFEQARAAAKHLRDIQLRYAALLDRLGPALDGEQRAMLLAADDYSAVSRRVPMSNLYERGRSLGIGVQVSAQSWQGLGADEDERYRIATTADGGIFVLHTPHPDPLAAMAGKRRVLETAHKLVGNTWGDEGTTREQRAWVADPDLIRRLEVGQACYIHHGAATFVQVARPAASPLTLLPPPAPEPPPEPPPAPAPEPRQEPTPPSWPPVGGLDDIFGPGDSR